MAEKAKSKSKKTIEKKDVRSSKSNILHSIKHIRENEKRVISILACFFIFVFLFIGYFTLKIDSNSLVSDIKNANDLVGISSSTRSITLDIDDVMSDAEGLKSTPVTLIVNNAFPDAYSYKLKLEEDEYLKKVCECDKKFDTKLIRYSLDGVNVKTIDNDDMILDFDSVDSYAGNDATIRIWISDTANLEEDAHFHGLLKIEECSKKESN